MHKLAEVLKHVSRRNERQENVQVSKGKMSSYKCFGELDPINVCLKTVEMITSCSEILNYVVSRLFIL